MGFKNKSPNALPPFSNRSGFAFITLFILVLLIYSNTFHASWHLDDYDNIVNNPRLHINNLFPRSIIQTFYASMGEGFYQGERIYRPVSCLTFALNWYIGNDRVTGYHLVNIFIHFLSAFILFHTILNIFNTPHLIGKYDGTAYGISLMATVLWAINPIQTQAVTYIVQRMASMAAMFFLLSTYFYIKARISGRSFNALAFYIGCIICFALAIGSKENTVILPVSLILVEIIFFQDVDFLKYKKFLLLTIGFTAFLIFLLISLFFLKGDLFSIFKTYEYREFTLIERLITEPRILFFYLSQIFYPVSNRFSIEHDVIVSKSLLEPWTTVPAILCVLLFIGIGIWQVKKRPLIAFSILFFFLNHSVESTILPLELIFEHRNYLPSFFLFLPFSIGLVNLIYRYKKNTIVCYSILLSLSFLITGISLSSYARNMDWATERSLWEDASSKAPKHHRPYINLACEYYLRIGRYEDALNLLKHALILEQCQTKDCQAFVLNNMGTIYKRIDDDEKGFESYQKALIFDPDNYQARYNLLLCYIEFGQWAKASEMVDRLLSIQFKNVIHLNLKAFVLIKQDRPKDALSYLYDALRLAPMDWKTNLYLGWALSLMGHYNTADFFLSQAHRNLPQEIIPLLCLIQNSVTAKQPGKIDQYAHDLFASFTVQSIEIMLEKLVDEKVYVDVSHELLVPIFRKKMMQYAIKIQTSSNDSNKFFK